MPIDSLLCITFKVNIFTGLVRLSHLLMSSCYVISTTQQNAVLVSGNSDALMNCHAEDGQEAAEERQQEVEEQLSEKDNSNIEEEDGGADGEDNVDDSASEDSASESDSSESVLHRA